MFKMFNEHSVYLMKSRLSERQRGVTCPVGHSHVNSATLKRPQQPSASTPPHRKWADR